MAVAARVGGRFRVGIGGKVSVGRDSETDSGVELASGNVGEANSKVGEIMVGVKVGNKVGVGVSGKCTRVGNSVGVA